MSSLESDLQNDGFEPANKESPFHDDGMLWKNSFELVCDETGKVIRMDGVGPGYDTSDRQVAELSDDTPRYENSGRVILPGGYASSYEWSDDDSEHFLY